MKFAKSILVAAGIGMIAFSFVPATHADEWNKKTYITVNEPIIAGNKVLQPGTYVWKLMDSSSDRHIVQIFNKEESHLETTVLAIPDYRVQPTGHTQFTFYETPAGVPKAVNEWFYPGDNFGQQLPYPKKLIAQLASTQPVPLPSNYAPPAETTENTAPPAAEPAPAPEPQEVAQNEAPAPPAAAPVQNEQPAPAATPEPQTLPKTGSKAPLIGLLGLFSLGLAGALTFAKKNA